MSKLKEMMSDWRYIKFCLYIVFTCALLYIIYLLIGNLDTVIISASAFIGSLFSALSPLIIGIVLAYLISPLVELINAKLVVKLSAKMPKDKEKREKYLGRQRTISILITFLIILLVFCLIVYAFGFLIIGGLVFTSVEDMINNIVSYFEKYEVVIKSWLEAIPNSELEEKFHELATNIITWFSSNFSTAAIVNFITTIGGSILNVFLGMVVSIYLLKDKEFFLKLSKKIINLIMPKKASNKTFEVLADVNMVVSQFVRGQLLDALIIAVLSSIGLTIIGLDFAVFIGCFAGLANVIPYFGPFLSMIPAVLIGFLTGGISQALLALLVLFIIQQLDSNIIYPKVVGNSTGLHPLFILISVTVGGYYLGIIGMIIAVPTAAIIKQLLTKKLDSLE